MEKERILNILYDWNFWGKGLEVGKERKKYLSQIIEIIESEVNKILSIYGVRRAGKSFILRQVAKFLSERYGKENVLYINFEEVNLEKSLETLIKCYETYLEFLRPTRKPIIILDEIQEINGWEKFVRSLHEKDEAKIIVSGSSSKIMSEELATLLAGRDITIEVFPLDFKEFLEFKDFKIRELNGVIVNKNEVVTLLREYIEFGGFPEVVIEKNKGVKKEILKRYFETILLKDVQKRFRIREVSKLEFLASFYATNISSLISYKGLSKILKIPDKTIERYSKYLSISRVLFFISKFSFSLKDREVSPRKVYFIDLGIPNSVGFKLLENYGKAIENLVAINLISRYRKPFAEVFYLKINDKEVDFVIKEGLNIKQLIQVTYASNKDEIEQREIKSLLKAYDLFKEYNPELLVITWDYEDVLKIDNKEIKFIPLWKWLLNL